MTATLSPSHSPSSRALRPRSAASAIRIDRGSAGASRSTAWTAHGHRAHRDRGIGAITTAVTAASRCRAGGFADRIGFDPTARSLAGLSLRLGLPSGCSGSL